MKRAFRCQFAVILTLVGAALPSGAGFALPRKGKLPPDLSEILSHMNESTKHLKTISANLEYTKVTVLVDDKYTETGRLLFRKDKGIQENTKPDESKSDDDQPPPDKP